MSDAQSEPVVEVNVEPEPSSDTPPIEVDAGDTIIVPEPSNESSAQEALAAEQLIDAEVDEAVEDALWRRGIEERLANVEGEVFAVSEAVEDIAEATEEVAEASAEGDAEVIDAIDGATVEKNEDGDLEVDVPDIEPATHKVHPLFKSFSEWRGGN